MTLAAMITRASAAWIAADASRWRVCLIARRIANRSRYGDNAIGALAQAISVGKDTIYRHADAGNCYVELRKRFSQTATIRRSLSYLHFATLWRLWHLYEFAPADALEILQLCADDAIPASSMAQHVRGTYADDPPPDAAGQVVRLVERAIEALETASISADDNQAAACLVAVHQARHALVPSSSRHETAIASALEWLRAALASAPDDELRCVALTEIIDMLVKLLESEL